MAEPALVVLIMIARHPSALTTGKLEKIKVYYLQDVEITQHTWYHTARSGGERDREMERGREGGREGYCEHGPGVLLLLGLGVGAWGFPRLTLYW